MSIFDQARRVLGWLTGRERESGQALPLALAALAVGALLVAPFLGSVSVHSIAAKTYTGSILQLSSCDAGVEDAIWGLTNGTLADDLTYAGDTSSYTVAESVNGITPTVSVTRDKVIIASDDFESGDWAGGSGWLAAWTQSGDSSLQTNQNPYQGSYHIRLRNDDGYVERAVDLSDKFSVRLQFWSKVKGFDNGDDAYCKISSNGSDWTTVVSWTKTGGQNQATVGATTTDIDNNTYYYYDIDLSTYAMSSQFWIAFEAGMNNNNDHLYVDDIELVRELPGAVLGLPNDNFESGGWSGGSGWLDDWYHEGDAKIKSSDSPHGGTYHLRMRKGNSYVDRAADLSGQSGLHLQLWAKIDGFESGDEVYCRTSPDDSNWTTVKTWTDADDDNTYHLYDIDLSAQAPYSSQFWIAFDSGMNNKKDYFYVDDLSIVGQSVAYEIVSTAGSERIRADIVVTGGSVAIEAWQMERQ